MLRSSATEQPAIAKGVIFSNTHMESNSSFLCINGTPAAEPGIINILPPVPAHKG